MTMLELIERINNKIEGVKPDKIRAIIKQLFEELKLEANSAIEELEKYNIDKVTLYTQGNFGRWEIVRGKIRKGRNPKTGEAIKINPKYRLKFYASGSYVKKINEGDGEDGS